VDALLLLLVVAYPIEQAPQTRQGAAIFVAAGRLLRPDDVAERG